MSEPLDLDALEREWSVLLSWIVDAGSTARYTKVSRTDCERVLSLIAKARVSNPQLDREAVALHAALMGVSFVSVGDTIDRREGKIVLTPRACEIITDTIIALGGGKEGCSAQSQPCRDEGPTASLPLTPLSDGYRETILANVRPEIRDEVAYALDLAGVTEP